MTAALIVAAGAGRRLGGGVPKAMRPLAGKPLYLYSLEAAGACPLVSAIALVVPALHLPLLRTDPWSGFAKSVLLVAGGETRQQSVLRGLGALPPNVEWVAVHDAARPLASSLLFQEVILLAHQKDGAISAHPAADTVKRVSADGAVQTLPRGELWHAETPQVFRRADLQRALERCEREAIQVTDEAEAMEQSGLAPLFYHNATANPKISTEADWSWVEALLRSR